MMAIALVACWLVGSGVYETERRKGCVERGRTTVSLSHLAPLIINSCMPHQITCSQEEALLKSLAVPSVRVHDADWPAME
mgnify:CR=1 FL=1